MRWLILVGLLGRVSGRLGRRMLPVLHSEGLSGLEMLVLWEVQKRGALRAGKLAGFFGVPPSTFTTVLDRLESRGLVERVPDPDDRRAVLVQGTPSLQGLLDRVAERAESELERLLGGLSGEDYRSVVEALTLLDRYLERRGGSRPAQMEV